jgi:hypothetical protein
VRSGVRGLLVAAVLAGTLPATASCGTDCSGVVIDYGSELDGFPTATAAVEDFLGRDGLAGLPRSGWHRDGGDQSDVTFRSGHAMMQVIQGSDGTWQVGEGRTC